MGDALRTLEEMEGTEGKLDVMLLAGENNLTEPRSPEDYEVQAQLGSNTTRLKVNVTAAPAVGSEERFRVPKYVSHIISQSDFIVSGDLPPRFRAFGRFAVKGVDTQALQTTRYAAALSASNYSEDLTTKVRWSVLGGGQVAAINSQANAATGEAELIMDRGKLTTNQLEVTVQAEYLDPRTNQSLGIAQAKVQIRR